MSETKFAQSIVAYLDDQKWKAYTTVYDGAEANMQKARCGQRYPGRRVQVFTAAEFQTRAGKPA